jgi:CheY-like chemotaxis protein
VPQQAAFLLNTGERNCPVAVEKLFGNGNSHEILTTTDTCKTSAQALPLVADAHASRILENVRRLSHQPVSNNMKIREAQHRRLSHDIFSKQQAQVHNQAQILPAPVPVIVPTTNQEIAYDRDEIYEPHHPSLLSIIFGRQFMDAISGVIHSQQFHSRIISSAASSAANPKTFLDDLQQRQKQLAQLSPYSWPNGDRRTFLVVDYNTPSRKNIVKTLTDHGQLVYQSTDGLGCLRALEDLKLRGDSVDVIIIEADDFMLPSLSGTDTIKLVKSRNLAAETIIIGLTTDLRKVMKVQEPFIMLIASPLNFDQLAEALKTIDDNCHCGDNSTTVM